MTTATPAAGGRKRRTQPAWRSQPPCMSVFILAGTGPTPKAAKYLRELECWLREAKVQMPRATPDAPLFAGAGEKEGT